MISEDPLKSRCQSSSAQSQIAPSLRRMWKQSLQHRSSTYTPRNIVTRPTLWAPWKSRRLNVPHFRWKGKSSTVAIYFTRHYNNNKLCHQGKYQKMSKLIFWSHITINDHKKQPVLLGIQRMCFMRLCYPSMNPIWWLQLTDVLSSGYIPSHGASYQFWRQISFHSQGTGAVYPGGVSAAHGHEGSLSARSTPRRFGIGSLSAGGGPRGSVSSCVSTCCGRRDTAPQTASKSQPTCE